MVSRSDPRRDPGERIRIDGRPAPWEPDVRTGIHLRLLPSPGGTTPEWEHRGGGSVFQGSEGDPAGWFAGSVALRGTPATPDPVASRIHGYTNSELVELARAAAFQAVEVAHPDLGRWARESGIPVDPHPFFEDGEGGRLLTARARHQEDRPAA
ncbi:MAG: hypothetical protein WAN74_06535 [Thermoplasmata archaeon]